MTKYEIMKRELESRFHLNAFHHNTVERIDEHEKAATHMRIYLTDTEASIGFWSYKTLVMSVHVPNTNNKKYTFNAPYIRITGLYSATTRKHIGWWMKLLVNMGVVPCNWNYFTVKQAIADREDKSASAYLYF